MNSSLSKNIISLVFFSIVQVLFFLNFNIFEYGFAFIYIGFILFLPLNTPTFVLLTLAFVQGLFIDLFYNTIGINALSLVTIAYLKPTVSKLFIPKMIDDINDLKSINQLGLERSLIVIFLLTFAHHFLLFFIINGGSEFILSNLVKTVFSSLITTLLLLSFKKMFFNSLNGKK